uniref:U-box domain-containing protein 51-like n=1 Tax=Fragaria vesca subsp. vesca TaxID=101020 RepID=UPI0005CAC3E4|nr:PREDICTED: U-box domain-containing protein 51-like [Fragaria vesca subsp. vesca]
MRGRGHVAEQHLKEQAVAVAIDKDKGSEYAIKWTINSLLTKGQALTLLHVRHPIYGQNASTENQKDHQSHELFISFRSFCAKKNIKCTEIVLEDNDIPNALIKYVKANSIEILVLGVPTKGGIFRFRLTDVPSSVVKMTPEFCSVYVITKGKISYMRCSTIAPPPPPPSSSNLQLQDHASNVSEASNSQFMRTQLPNIKASERMHYQSGNQHFDEIRSPFRRGRHSMDRSYDLSPDIDISIDDVELEMRRLRLELMQTTEMYNTTCKEARTAKHKSQENELNRCKIEEGQRLEEARLAEEFALVEREKTKCQAAIQAAASAKRLAELEAQMRWNHADNIARKESEEMKKTSEARAYDVRYRRYTIEDIEVATCNFLRARKIGEGGYGPVYKGELDHTQVAIKVLRPDAAQGRSQFQQEVEVLSCIRHPNMVLLLGACPEFGCLVYEYMGNGSLEDRLFCRGNTPVIPWQLRFRIAAEIATGLLFLHQAKPEPLVHRDLKPSNILLDNNYVSKISDLGLARLVPPSVADVVTQYHMTSTAGTFCYIDPEYQQTGMLGTKSDIYSLGVLLLQIITAKPPMGLTHQVERAIETGRILEMLDPAVHDWPVEEALKFAKLSLQCAEMRKKDRPDLGKVVLPVLNRLRAFAEDSLQRVIFGGGGVLPPNQNSNSASQVSCMS